jgi:TrmH family RNA methyltransferase
MDWERLPVDPFAALEGPFFALETGGIAIADFPFPRRGIMIAGSEELGVSPRALAAADASLGRISIPTWGAKGSLNVSGGFRDCHAGLGGAVVDSWRGSHTPSALWWRGWLIML